MTIYYFYSAVILSQILVVSLYAPSIVARRVHALLATRPPAEYPKLYPVPVATIERTLRLYGNLNTGIAVLGLALLAAAWVYGYFGSSDKDSAIPYAIYTMLQVAPIMLWSIWEKRYFKRMHAAAHKSVRKAQLKPRRLFDLVSPTTLGVVVATYLGATASLVLLSPSFPEPLLGFTFMFTAMTIWNLAAAALIVWTPKKWDPHQTHDDRARGLRAVWRAATFTVIVLNAYVALQTVLTSFDVMQYAGFAASLLTQFFVVAGAKATVLVLNQEDFEVYKTDAKRA
jgi:hypothetical protein